MAVDVWANGRVSLDASFTRAAWPKLDDDDVERRAFQMSMRTWCHDSRPCSPRMHDVRAHIPLDMPNQMYVFRLFEDVPVTLEFDAATRVLRMSGPQPFHMFLAWVVPSGTELVPKTRPTLQFSMYYRAMCVARGMWWWLCDRF